MGSGLGVRVTMIAVGRGVGVCSGVAVSLAAPCSAVGVGAGAGLVATGGAVGGKGVGSDLSHGKQPTKSAAASKAPASPLDKAHPSAHHSSFPMHCDTRK